MNFLLISGVECHIQCSYDEVMKVQMSILQFSELQSLFAVSVIHTLIFLSHFENWKIVDLIDPFLSGF